MGLCKCMRCPQQGKFVEGRYYVWQYALKERFFGGRGRTLTDDLGNKCTLFAKGYGCCFKEVGIANVSISIYIDRKRELIYVPEFRHEAGYSVALDRFERLPFPYETGEVGRTFLAVWEASRDYPVVSAGEVERTTPYYKIVTKGKGFKAFSESRWMIGTEFISSEKEIIFNYWYRKGGGAFGRDATDRRIERIIKLSADNETIGNAILDVFREVGVP